MATASSPVRVLFFAHAMQSRGTERAVIRILKHLDRSAVAPELALVSATGDFMADIPSDVPVHRLGLEGRRTSAAVVPLARLVRARRIEVAVGVHTSAARLVSSMRLLRPGMPVICFESDPFSRVEGAKGAYLLRRLLTKVTHRALATRVVAASDAVAADLTAELRIPLSRIQVIPIPSVDPAMFETAGRPVDQALFDVPVVMSLGHMFEHKDQRTLMAAFAKLRERMQARLIMIGDGPMRAPLESQAAELRIGRDVVFLGFQADPFRYLSRAQVFVSPSISEGFDVAQVEAMALGVPVVVTDAPRYEAVQHEESGLVVPPRDPAAMADAIHRLLTDRDLAHRLARAGEVSAKELSSEAVTKRWEELILALAGRQSGSNP